MGEANKFDTSVQQSLTNERNITSPQIEEESMKSVFSKIVKETNSSERMNLTNSAIIEPPKLRSFGHPSTETENVGGIAATRIENPDGIWRRTTRDYRTAHTHDDIETISKQIAYRTHIRDLEFETRKVLERETLKKNIENIGTRLDKNLLDNNQITWSADSSKHRKKNEPEVNQDPEPLSSD